MKNSGVMSDDAGTRTKSKADPPSPTDGLTAGRIAEAIDRVLVHLIPLEEIHYSHRAADPKEQKGHFNLRRTSGFDRMSMEDLESSIAQDGLLEYPNVRPHPSGEGYQLLGGERRLRAIRALVERGERVYDEATDRLVPAGELYAVVPCRVIRNATDQRAMRITSVENSTQAAVSEKDTIEAIECLLEMDNEETGRKYSRKEVAGMLGRSEAWLCKTLSFKTKLDPVSLQQLYEGSISRSFAIHLMDYPEHRRVEVKEAAITVAEGRYEDAHERAEAEQAEAEMHLVNAEELRRRATGEKQRVADCKVDRAKNKLVKATNRLDAIKREGVQLQQSDLDMGAIQIGVDPVGTKGLSTKQLHDHWLDQLNLYLMQGQVRQKDTNRVYPRRDLTLLKFAAQFMADGVKGPLEALDAFYKDQGGWGVYGAEGLAAGARAIRGDVDLDDEDMDEGLDDFDLDDEDLDGLDFVLDEDLGDGDQEDNLENEEA